MEIIVGLLNRVPRADGDVCANLFISHNWGHGYRREDLHRLIENKWIKDVDFCDFAISKAHPLHNAGSNRALMDALALIIGQCDVLLVFAGLEGNNSAWMEREIVAARSLGVPVIAVVPLGAERRWTTAIELADKVVNWRGDSIRAAILERLPRTKATDLVTKITAREYLRTLRLDALGSGTVPPARSGPAFPRARQVGLRPPTGPSSGKWRT